jgi:hypothetical protein
LIANGRQSTRIVCSRHAIGYVDTRLSWSEVINTVVLTNVMVAARSKTDLGRVFTYIHDQGIEISERFY